MIGSTIGSLNSRQEIMQSAYDLNKQLHSFGLPEWLRSQFVGTCLLALKNGLIYINNDRALPALSVRSNISSVLNKLLDGSEDKDEKLELLKTSVLESPSVQKLNDTSWKELLDIIKNGLLPHVNDMVDGQDVLNLFFTAFNKYVQRDDNNQVFTPDHITHFMCKLTGVDKHTVVLDPCCGSGSFLVQALVMACNDCKDDADRIEDIKKSHFYGIEIDRKAFGLSTTNMLIHSNGNSNIIEKSCFDAKDFIIKVNPDIVLMNPPYVASRDKFPKDLSSSKIENTNCETKEDQKNNITDLSDYDNITELKDLIYDTSKNQKNSIKDLSLETPYCSVSWNHLGKTTKSLLIDPTGGLSFVDYIMDCLIEAENTTAELAVLLPMSCAIGTKNSVLKAARSRILEKATLEAVFSLPDDLFYPGASVNVCCMLFKVGDPHMKNGKPKRNTFFGYCKDDGFRKKKYLGRIETTDANGKSVWRSEIEPKWINAYQNIISEAGFCTFKRVTANDEWLAEAYMETDYSQLTQKDFQQSINDYLSFLIKREGMYDN